MIKGAHQVGSLITFKSSVFMIEMEDNGDVKEQYEISNDESAWAWFRERYHSMEQEISLEASTSRKYVARKLRDMDFSVHLTVHGNVSEKTSL